MRPARDPKVVAQEQKAARQRCLCGHQRRHHAYRRNFHHDPSACRKCKVQGCSCPNFILLQRSMM